MYASPKEAVVINGLNEEVIIRYLTIGKARVNINITDRRI